MFNTMLNSDLKHWQYGRKKNVKEHFQGHDTKLLLSMTPLRDQAYLFTEQYFKISGLFSRLHIVTDGFGLTLRNVLLVNLGVLQHVT